MPPFLKKINYFFEPRFRFLKLLPSNGIVLDCGCGDFESTNKLRECRRDLLWHCIDRTMPEKEVPGDVEFTLLNLEKQRLPYSDSFFDGIYALHVVEHIGNLENMTSELNRVLKPDGYIFIEVPSIHTLCAPTSAIFFCKMGNFYDDITHRRIFTKPALRDLLRNYFSLNIVKVGTARNLVKIVSTPFLLIYSFLKWRGYFMIGLGEILGFRNYCIGKK